MDISTALAERYSRAPPRVQLRDAMYKETPYLAVIAIPEVVHRAEEFCSAPFVYLEALMTLERVTE
ncbi:hypothetical protein ACFWUZ_17665 [Streptomyces sp. NPDC058646]|uniref:hypothetical protein n=1 Tax=Streptomyces sp. NPDC058646 TaxID=3346574 RepID=UPI0036538BA0